MTDSAAFLDGYSRRLFYVERSWAREGFDLYLIVEPREPGGERKMLTGLTVGPVPEFQPLPRAPITLSETEAQHLMDELWRAGLRPSAGHGTAGQLAATQAHLEDMRRLVWEMVVGRPTPTEGPHGQ